MLRLVKALHDQSVAKHACHSALRWYCGKFYGQGGANLDVNRKAMEALKGKYGAPVKGDRDI